MDTTPLITKLYIPPPCQTLVPRPRLTMTLAQAPARCLTLVCAPAGYGKTTLVSNWLREIDVSSTWLSLDDGDNDPIRFLQYFITALQNIVPSIRVDLPGMLQGVQPPPLDTLLNLVINTIAVHAEPFVFVLDDFHVIHAQPVLDMLTFLLEHAPPSMHLVLLSRTDPPLPLARLRVRNQMVDIRADQLRFTPAETALFLNQVMGLNLSAGDVAAMEARTEGWIAGLQLAALSMQGRTGLHNFVAAFTGSHHYIMDYLVEQVLELQSELVRSFLLRTSILDRMCAQLCQVVATGDTDEPFDAQAMLEALERANLFLVPLDGERRWYRYHHLFADVLARRLERLFPEQLAELHRRASAWYEQNGFITAATHHALLAGNRDRAAMLVEQHGCDLMMRGEVATLLRWLQAVESFALTHPWLAILHAWALTLTGEPDRAEPMLHAAEQRIARLEASVEVSIMLGTVAAARAHTANVQGEADRAADFARQALEYLPDDSPFARSLRSVAISILGDASWMAGDLQAASRAYMEAAQISREADNIYVTVIANANLAHVLTEHGRLYQAARIYSETLALATRPDGISLPLADSVYAGLSRISYMWNHLEAASRYAHQCIDLCRQWGNYDLLAVGYVQLARLEHAQCNPTGAQEAMRAAGQLVSEHRLTSRRAVAVRSALARLWLAQGNPERASQIVQHSGIALDDEIHYQRESEYLTLLRLLLAQGAHDAALALSERLLHMLETAGRMGRVIEILVLRALAFQGNKDVAGALAVLERAFSLAQPEGYVRVFLDEGEPMAKLLHQARSHGIGAGFAAELLAALGTAPGTAQPPAQLLIEPLSMRELEVLRLIEAGRSNQEIAAKLVISITTVKRHISNIYGKLGVKSRTQAISLARELGLFQ